jgi:Xaa-Pro dipeptidase
MIIKRTPKNELQNRMEKFKIIMEETYPEWEIAVIFSKINQYYFTGTMQDGMLIIPRYDEPNFWVRRSYERALNESLFSNIKSMNSYRDAAGSIEKIPETIYLETEVVPIALYNRFKNIFHSKIINQ